MNTKFKYLLGAALSLLVTFAFTHNAAAQASSDRIAFLAPVYAQNVTSGHGKPTYSSTVQVFSMKPDGTDVQQLTSGAECLGPKWSPDQKYILFERAGNLYIMEAKGEINGGRIFAVAQAPGLGEDWSPDGLMVCFTDASGLWIVDVNAATGEVGTPTLIREDDSIEGDECQSPAWSPDGTQIAFENHARTDTNVVTVLDLASGSEFAFPVRSALPSWSPDGSSIAFDGVTGPYTTTKGHKVTSIDYYWGIFVANADGSDVTRVTYLESNTVSPTWSPDSTELVFTSAVSGTTSLYSMPLASGAVSLLWADAWQADWAP